MCSSDLMRVVLELGLEIVPWPPVTTPPVGPATASCIDPRLSETAHVRATGVGIDARARDRNGRLTRGSVLQGGKVVRVCMISASPYSKESGANAEVVLQPAAVARFARGQWGREVEPRKEPARDVELN